MDPHYIRITSCTKMYALFVCVAIQKVTMVSKQTIIQLSLYPWVTGHLYASI
jgi:hypothetical protein